MLDLLIFFKHKGNCEKENAICFLAMVKMKR